MDYEMVKIMFSFQKNKEAIMIERETANIDDLNETALLHRELLHVHTC